MNKLKKYLLVLAVFVIANVVSPLKINAQPSDPGCDPLDPACPVDGGISLLIAAGIGLGVKKAYDLKRKEIKNS